MQLYKGGGKMTKYKTVVIVNDENDTLICSKQFSNFDDSMEYVKECMKYDNYRVEIYNVKVVEKDD